MPLKKNDIIRLEITSCSLQGCGIGRHEGMAVFVPAAAAGDTLLVHILKVKKSCAFGKVKEILKSSPDRVENDCPAFPQCGGCMFRHISYDAELKIKEAQVRENFRRIGGIDITPEPIIGADNQNGYRNKAQYPLEKGENGLKIGFYAQRSHRVIDCRACRLQPEAFTRILSVFDGYIEKYNIPVYDEESHTGLLRHIFIRMSPSTGDATVCAVINGGDIPHSDGLVTALTKACPEIKSIVLNINRENTNVILGEKCVTLWGGDYITDVLCGLKFRISPLSFYQVNAAQAEKLYKKAGDFAEFKGTETVLDLYCGTGTIGLTLSASAGRVIGVETVAQAVEDARINAAENNIENAEFICADAAEAAAELKTRGVSPDVVILDPPRKGCPPQLIETVAGMTPEKIVYVSCDSATQARDCRLFASKGYKVTRCAPVDMFPRTGHVECVVLMSRVEK